ncbi:MAG TPA: hypothetical protein VK978_01400 [Candidatus Saccharimonadales bacterium]|nr:hypothetical protein [Candidatus Saccharimonadales bacterium]
MNGIWTPEYNPPQINETALTTVRLLLDEDYAGTINDATTDLDTRHDAFGSFLDQFGFALNKASEEGIWPAKTLKAAAAVTLLAYREAGIFTVIDEKAVKMGRFTAELYGIPDTYVVSMHDDKGLMRITDAVQEKPAFNDSHLAAQHTGGYGQVLQLGSGCARHYLQQAIQLAAA